MCFRPSQADIDAEMAKGPRTKTCEKCGNVDKLTEKVCTKCGNKYPPMKINHPKGPAGPHAPAPGAPAAPGAPKAPGA
jgi:hypothetical protein